MKKLYKKLSLLITLLLILIYSCKNGGRNVTGDKVFRVNIDNPETTIDLKLSDLFDSVWLVPLETTKGSLIGGSFYCLHAGDDFILINDMSGIYKFSPEGRFIKKLINIGRGPEEILHNYDIMCYYESRNLLIIQRNKDYLLQYDVRTEKFLDPIKKWNPEEWAEFKVFNDSLIIASYQTSNRSPDKNAVFIQNFKGKFIYGIPSKKVVKIGIMGYELLRRMNIHNDNKNFHVNYLYDDTLFTINDNHLTPYIIALFDSPRKSQQFYTPYPGERSISFPETENNCFAIIKQSLCERRELLGQSTFFYYSLSCFLLDLNSGKTSKIRSYTDDFTGKSGKGQNFFGERIIFPAILPNGRLYKTYNAYDLLALKSAEQNWQKFPPGFNEKFDKIVKNLDAMDNPVLLIGKIRNRLNIDLN